MINVYSYYYYYLINIWNLILNHVGIYLSMFNISVLSSSTLSNKNLPIIKVSRDEITYNF